MNNRLSSKFLRLVVLVLFVSIPVVTLVETVWAQDEIDVSGIWRSKGQNKYHIEFVKKGTQLIATFVYDDKALALDYGERQPFFTATLNGKKFDGRMDYYQSKGAIVTGNIKDNKIIEFIDGSRSGETVLYRQ